MKKSEFLKVGLFFLILSLVATRGILATPGTIGHQWDWSIPSEPVQLQQMAKKALYAWGESAGGHTRAGLGLSNTPFNLLAGLPGFFGLGGDFTSKGIIILTITLSGVSFYLLARTLLQNKPSGAALLAGTLYALSPFAFNEFHGGGTTQFLSYALLPITVAAFIKQRFLATVLLTSLVAISHQNLTFASLVFLFWSLFSPQRRDKLAFFAKVGLTTLLVNTYWIVPFLLNFSASASFLLSPDLTSLNSLYTKAPPLDKALLGIGYVNRDFFNWRQQMLWGKFGYAPTLVALLTLLYFFFRSKLSHSKILWLSVFTGSLILTTAARPPFGKLILTAYEKVPLTNLFRSPYHYLTLTTLSLACLIAYGLKELFKKTGGNKISFILGTLLILTWIYPFLADGDLGRQHFRHLRGGSFLSMFQTSPTYREILQILKTDSSLGRVLYSPSGHSPYYLETPWQEEGQGSEPAHPNSPYATLSKGTAPDPRLTKIVEILDRELSERGNLEHFNQLADLFAIKYLLLRNDTVDNFGEFTKAYRYPKIHKILAEDTTWKLVLDSPEVSFWEKETFKPKFQLTAASPAPIAENKEVPEHQREIPLEISAPFPLEIIEEAEIVISSDNLNPSFFNYSLEIEGRGVAGKEDLQINITEHPCLQKYEGQFSPLVCVNIAPITAVLDLATSGEGTAVSLRLKDGTRWIEITLSNPDPTGGAWIENLVLKELPREKTELENELTRILETETRPVPDAIKINPTHYQLEIERPNSPMSLIFSETFDPHWTLDSPSLAHPLSSERVRLFANGWQLDPQDFLGEEETIQLEVRYEIQELWKRSAQFSVATLVLLTGWALWKHSNKKNQKS